MKAPIKHSLAVLCVAVVVVACGDARATEAAQDEFERDLKLASSTVSLSSPPVDASLLTSLETQPAATKAPTKVTRAASGDRAVRSRTPTVQASPVEEVAAIEESLEEVEAMAEAPAPETSNEPAAVVPRSAPVPVVGTSEGDYGTGSSGGGIIGVVIRGGGVDGDNCELHRRGRGGVRGGGPVYIPSPTYPTTGGGVTVGRSIPRTSVPDRRLPTGTTRGIGARIRGR